jgi:hypothetical protein
MSDFVSITTKSIEFLFQVRFDEIPSFAQNVKIKSPPVTFNGHPWVVSLLRNLASDRVELYLDYDGEETDSFAVEVGFKSMENWSGNLTFYPTNKLSSIHRSVLAWCIL